MKIKNVIKKFKKLDSRLQKVNIKIAISNTIPMEESHDNLIDEQLTLAKKRRKTLKKIFDAAMA